MGPAKVPAESPFIYNERRAAGVLRSWGNAGKKSSRLGHPVLSREAQGMMNDTSIREIPITLWPLHMLFPGCRIPFPWLSLFKLSLGIPFPRKLSWALLFHSAPSKQGTLPSAYSIIALILLPVLSPSSSDHPFVPILFSGPGLLPSAG